MILFKYKTLKITIEKDLNGFYTAFQKNKRIFGAGWDKKRLVSDMTRKQALFLADKVKNDLATKGLI